jgi:hypothetical protein
MALEAFSPAGTSEFLGVGLLAHRVDTQENQPWEPTLFVGGHQDWEELGNISIRLAIGWQEDAGAAPVRVVGLPGAELLVGTGDRCDTPAEWGTLGARVTAKSGTGTGSDAVLIAGHVASAKGTIVSDQAGHALGTVTHCIHPGQAKPQQATGDVAVVELDPGSASAASPTPRRPRLSFPVTT